MPSLVTWPEYIILLAGGLFAIAFGIGAAIWHMLRK
jgi:hypothetical protein